MPTLKRKLPPASSCCATFNFHFFCFSITNTLACHPSVPIQTFSRFVGALVAPISRGNGACIQTRHILLPSPANDETSEINSRADFLPSTSSFASWTACAKREHWRVGTQNGIAGSLENPNLSLRGARVFWKRVISTDRGQIWEMRIEVPGNSGLLFG